MKSATEFIRFRFSEEISKISPLVQEAFAESIQWLQQNPHTKGFDENSKLPDLDDTSPYGVSKQFFWYFETHFFKVHNSLLLARLESQKHHNGSWLDQPYLCVLDIGCGTGAATCALLDILVSYHEFRKQLGLPVHITHLSLAGIDPSQFAFDIYGHLLEILLPSLERENIFITVTQIDDEFPHPDCIEKIIKDWDPVHPFTLLGISSNVIRPLQNQWERTRSYLKVAGITQEFNLGEIVAKAYDKIINEFNFEQVLILDIATRNKIRKGFSLFDALRGFWKFIRNFFGQQSKFEWWSSEEELIVHFHNSPNSFHGKNSLNEHVVRSNYLHELYTGICNDSYCDGMWRKVNEVENIILGWVRARNYVLHDDIVDEVELKLIDTNWEEHLLRLRLHLDVGDLSLLYCDDLIYYPFPKNEREDRPKYNLSITEQLSCAAVSQSFPDSFKPVDNNLILGNRLNHEKNELFYEPWFGHHKAYSKAINNASVQGKYVCKTDVKSYYVNIKQSDLYRLLIKAMNADNSKRIKEVLSSAVLRQLINPPHSTNFGLPQSGITGGLWSSIYLLRADKEIISELDEKAQFFRYADDMAVIDDVNNIDSTLSMIQEKLNSLGLILNRDKTTNPIEAEEYIAKVKDDPRIKKISRGVSKVLDSLYFLPQEYQKEYLRDRDDFLEDYIDLLSEIGIHFSNDWLNRKIVSRSTTIHRLWHSVRGMRINFPEFPKNDTQKKNWRNEFESINQNWIFQRDNLISELVNLFEEAFNQITKPTELDATVFTQARRTLRFSAYRLVIFGVNPIIGILEKLLIKQPNLLSSKIMLKALVDEHFTEIVINLAEMWKDRSIPENIEGNNIECASYLCATACWALGYSVPSQSIIEFLYAVLLSEQSTLHEKLLASEALIRLGTSMPQQNEIVMALLEKDLHLRLQKNFIILCHLNNPDDFYKSITHHHNDYRSAMIQDAIMFLSAKQENILALKEPKIIELYYSRWYPDIPAHMRQNGSSSLFFG